MNQKPLLVCLGIAALIIAGCTTQQSNVSLAPDEQLQVEGMSDEDMMNMPCHKMPDGTMMGDCGEVKTITIDAYNWGFTKEPVTINKRDVVKLRLTSSQGTHGIAIPEFGVVTGRVDPGQEEIIEFVADKSGTFEFFCNVPCGQGHRGMRGELVVK